MGWARVLLVHPGKDLGRMVHAIPVVSVDDRRPGYIDLEVGRKGSAHSRLGDEGSRAGCSMNRDALLDLWRNLHSSNCRLVCVVYHTADCVRMNCVCSRQSM